MPKGSYTTSLFDSGLVKISQKVGEEAVETILAATNESIDDFKGEAADLIYHLIVLCREKGLDLAEVVGVLKQRK